ncbi:MAG: hypothetical protein LBQ15_10375 [Clostridium sp.]|jgi:hypothetical protein|nr:hypothetical protein [Clostridium sp.]
MYPKGIFRPVQHPGKWRNHVIIFVTVCSFIGKAEKYIWRKNKKVKKILKNLLTKGRGHGKMSELRLRKRQADLDNRTATQA